MILLAPRPDPIACAGLLVIARLLGRPLRTDARLATVLALLPFALAYGLIYWGEQYVPSGLAAVLFGILPLYTALLGTVLLPDEPLRAPLLAGVLIGWRLRRNVEREAFGPMWRSAVQRRDQLAQHDEDDGTD